jgi:hypothetical protein
MRRADGEARALGKDSQRRSGDAERSTLVRMKASPLDGLFTRFFIFLPNQVHLANLLELLLYGHVIRNPCMYDHCVDRII